MRFAFIPLLLMAQTASAAMFQGTVDFDFSITEIINGVAQGEKTTAPVNVILDTDYSSRSHGS